MATGTGISNALSIPAVRKAASSIKNGNWMRNRIAAEMRDFYGEKTDNASRLVSDNPAARTLKAVRGRAQGAMNVPNKKGAIERFQVTIDATGEYDVDNQDKLLKFLLMDVGQYYEHRIGLDKISDDVLISVEGSEQMYAHGFKNRFCNSTYYLLGVKFKLVSSRRPADANYQSSVAEMPGGIELYRIDEKRMSSKKLDLDLMESPDKINNNIGFMGLIEEERIMDRFSAWEGGIYAGQKWHMYLEFAAYEAGY